MIANLPRWTWILLVGGLLLLPSLGTYGLWDPSEIKEADVAREVVEKASFGDVTVDGQYSARPVLTVWLVAAGFKLLGVSELAGRLPLALCGLLALLLAYRVGRRLVAPWAGLLAAFVLGTTPTFLFQSRQLVGEVPFYACLIASAGGLAAFIWPADGRRSRLDLVIGGLGLVLGFLARGLLLGTALPLLALGLAVALAWRSEHRGLTGEREGLWPADDGTDLKEGQSVGQALRGAGKPLALTLVLAAAIIGGLVATLKNGPFLLLGDELRPVSMPPVFHDVFRDLGFGFYPWFALLPLALLSFLWKPAAAGPVATDGCTATEDSQPPAGRDALPKLLIVALATLGYAAAAIWPGYLGAMRFPSLPWLAIGVGLLLYEAWHTHARYRLWGMVAAALILALQQDFVAEPASLAFSHLLAKAKYPVEVDIKLAMRVFGGAFTVLFFLALGGGPKAFAATRLTSRVSPDRLRQTAGVRWLARTPGLGWVVYGVTVGAAWVIDQLSWLAARVGQGLRRVGGTHGRHFWVAAGVATLLFAGWCVHVLTPQLSHHMSNKALFGTYHQCKQQGERLTQYLVTGRGAAYYNDGQVDSVKSQNELFALLRKPERSFVLLPTGQLGAIDQAARQAKVPYFVLDDSNSQYLIISNKLGGACNEDKNPLRKLVLRTPPTPRKRLLANFENRVQLIGYDVDDVVSRGGKFRITLYYKVLARLPANYKIFIHFDQPSHRFHGDHQPLDGKYPTQYWLPGDYIVDPQDVEIPMLTTPTGRYNIMTGFWLGSTRLKVISGPADKDNRVRLGTIRVRAF